MESSDNQTAPKRRGRPRTFAENATERISVSIEARQKRWLEEKAATSPSESASKIVREALDLWYAVNVEGKSLVGAPNRTSPQSADDNFDYSWQ